MKKDSRIYIAGHNGLVGSAITRYFRKHGFKNLILRSHKQLELMDQAAVDKFFKKERPEYIFLAAAKVGGIMANKTHKADFIYENLEVQNNVIYNSWKYKVKKLLFLGSSCIYPKAVSQPIREQYMLTGPLEETNDAYAMAKLAGIKMCQSFNEQYKTNFISVMPTNLYGPNDNYDLSTSHVLPAMIRKFHDAKLSGKKDVTLWGSGQVYREFLHVDDMADACVFLMKNYNSSEIINIGCGEDLTIKELAKLVKGIVGFKGQIKWDRTKPDGMLRKRLDVRRLNSLGWKPKIKLEEGVKQEYRWFVQNYKDVRK